MATRARSNKVSFCFVVFMIYDIFMDVARKYLSDNKESPRFFWDDFMSTHINIREAKEELVSDIDRNKFIFLSFVSKEFKHSRHSTPITKN